MELIYFARSEAFPNLIKIGRTDRDVQARMDELSDENYGPEGFDGNADWESVGIIKVADNTKAEGVLHEHFAEIRISDNRELFSADDHSLIIDEATTLVDGEIILETSDWLDGLDFLDLGPVPIGAAAVLAMSAYSSLNPNSEMAKKAETNRNTRDLRLKKNTEVLFTDREVKPLTRAIAGLGVLTGWAKKGADAAGATVADMYSEFSEEFSKEINPAKRRNLIITTTKKPQNRSINEILSAAENGTPFPESRRANLRKWKLNEDWLGKCEKKLGNKRLHPIAEFRASRQLYESEAEAGNPVAQLALASAIGNLYKFRPDIRSEKIPEKFFTGETPTKFKSYLWRASKSGMWAACLTLANFLMDLPDRNVKHLVIVRGLCKFALLGNGNASVCRVSREDLVSLGQTANNMLSKDQQRYSDLFTEKLVLDFEERQRMRTQGAI